MFRLFATLALAGACVAGMCFAGAAAGRPDPRDLRLVDQRGSAFTLNALRGEPAFVTFVATRCSDACPLAEAEFARLSRRLRGERVPARLVTITLDPAYDTPFVMARAARALDAQAPGWRLASGDPATVAALMRAFGVVARKDAAGVPDEHSTFVYVLDARVRLVKTLLLSSGFAEEALRAARALPRLGPRTALRLDAPRTLTGRRRVKMAAPKLSSEKRQSPWPSSSTWRTTSTRAG